MKIHQCFRTVIFAFLALVVLKVNTEAENFSEFIVFTVATENNDGFERFMDSAAKFNYNVKVLGMGQEWTGGDVALTHGGGQKVRLLKEALEPHKYSGNLVVMFVDSYDVVFTIESDRLLKRFQQFDVNVVFSAEAFCWPDISLDEFYPTVSVTEKRYLNSGAFMGYAPQLYTISTSSTILDDDDDQLFYTNIFLNERKKYKMILDTKSYIFQNLNGALDDVTVKFEDDHSFLFNIVTQNIPAVVHGNGPIKAAFSSITNYIPDQWSPTQGCIYCSKNTISLDGVEPDALPVVYVAVFIEQLMPFVEDFFIRLSELTYPKHKMHLFVHYFDFFHAKEVEKFEASHSSLYKSFEVLSSEVIEYEARQQSYKECMKLSCDYYLHIDGESQIEKPDLLHFLIQRNRSMIAPMMGRPGKMWTNFWGAVNSEGYYKRSLDYGDLVSKQRLGIWNVPYITNLFLLKATHLPHLIDFEVPEGLDNDVALCHTLRNKYIHMYVDNTDYFGHLVSNDNFETNHLNNDLYTIFTNAYTWDKKYIHPDYYVDLFNTSFTNFSQPCPDVYKFHTVTEKFCEDLVSEMEANGGWSGGKNVDARLQGGYENVPTVDIHTNQINWEKHWLQFLKLYIAPLSSKAFEGYYSESRAVMNFVVRYRPEEQDRLRAHSDSSTFTINIALNNHSADYEGGGVRLIRYNCDIKYLPKGSMLMHPGRLTHQHEGLPVTAGTRYIMVSFIDP